jgi:ceramide glucosyltransferase
VQCAIRSEGRADGRSLACAGVADSNAHPAGPAAPIDSCARDVEGVNFGRGAYASLAGATHSFFPVFHLITYELAATAGLICLIVGCGYGLTALLAVLLWKWAGPSGGRSRTEYPAVTVLKPLCGAEEHLYESLRSFFLQDYPEFQIVFGVRDGADPAIAVVKRLAMEFPEVPIELVVDPRQHGSNRKVSSLINMLPHARHEVLAIVDSDAQVDERYLGAVVGALDGDRVGLVTCTYRSVPAHGVWSRLGAMYINDWYIPAVRLAWLFGHRGFASGQTLCLRRQTLEVCGGLQPICNHLADDYKLGERVRAVGLKTVLSEYVTQAQHYEPTLAHLLGHEIRWMRTIRALQPQEFRFLFVSFSLPVALVGFVLTHLLPALASVSAALLAVTLLARFALYLATHRTGKGIDLSDLWLVVTRDFLLFWVWWRALRTSRVTWRGHEFAIDSQGVMRIVT